MTILEVVIATAMLGVVAGAMFSAYGFAMATEAKQQQRLGAAEVANRLVLNYLDDPSGMPDQNKTLDGGPGGVMKYRWELAEESVRLVEAAGDQRDQTRSSPMKNDRFRNVVVRVWLSEESGGSRHWEVSTPSVTLSRMLDPVYPRNADSYMAMLKNPASLQRIVEAIMGGAAAGGGPSDGAVSGFERAGGGANSASASGFRTRAPSMGGSR